MVKPIESALQLFAALSLAGFIMAPWCFAQSSTTRKPQVAAPLWKQEPNGFKGHKFGSSISDVVGEGNCRDGACTFDDSLGKIEFEITYYFRGDNLVKMEGFFGSESYADLRAIFIGAYGNPHWSDHHVEKNAMGATFQNEILGWNGKRVDLFIAKYWLNSKDGAFTLQLKSNKAEDERLQREEKRKAIESIK